VLKVRFGTHINGIVSLGRRHVNTGRHGSIAHTKRAHIVIPVVLLLNRRRCQIGYVSLLYRREVLRVERHVHAIGRHRTVGSRLRIRRVTHTLRCWDRSSILEGRWRC
jgi:hypothetical protein